MPDEYDEYDLDFSDIKIELSLARKTFDDISILSEWQKMVWNMFRTQFFVNRSGSYDFQNIPVLFNIIIGAVLEDIPVLFSIIRQPQSLATYIMQKLYCVCSEIGAQHDDLLLQSWNVSPNKTWYVDVTNAIVTLYDTQADMLNGVNPVATGEADEYTLDVVLSYVDEYEGDVAFYYSDLLVHLYLSEIISGTRQFKVNPLTDIAELRHPIYNNSNIIISKGEAELNLHTYMVLKKGLVLGTHLPELEPGDVISLTSTRRGTTEKKSQVLSETISGSISGSGEASLVNTIQIADYKELSR